MNRQSPESPRNERAVFVGQLRRESALLFDQLSMRYGWLGLLGGVAGVGVGVTYFSLLGTYLAAEWAYLSDGHWLDVLNPLHLLGSQLVMVLNGTIPPWVAWGLAGSTGVWLTVRRRLARRATRLAEPESDRPNHR